MEFKVDKNPYDRQLFEKEVIELNPNTITCLVGCNGTGKTTIIEYIKRDLAHRNAEECKNSVYPKLEDDIRKAVGKEKPKNEENLFYVDFSKHTRNAKSELDAFLVDAGVAFSSTGEGLSYRLGKTLEVLGRTVTKLTDKKATLFIFFDDCDAGTSLDKIVEIKDVMYMVADHCKQCGITYYIILTANSYEMCRGLDCISVHNFEHIEFNDYGGYEAYKEFVLKSAKIKEKSFEEAE